MPSLSSPALRKLPSRTAPPPSPLLFGLSSPPSTPTPSRLWFPYQAANQLPLKPGINLIVGKNNTGKSALLDALSMSAQVIPHRSFGENEEILGTGNPAATEFR